MSLNQLLADRRKRYMNCRVESLKIDGALTVSGGITETKIAGTNTVYQDFTNGSDANDGTLASPVKTMKAAIDKLAESSYQRARIVMLDSVNETVVSDTVPGIFNWAEDSILASVLDFSSLSSKYSSIEVEHDVPSPIALDTTTVGTWFSTWNDITGAGVGFTPNQYRSMVVYNADNDKYHGVASNTATDINLVGGDLSANDSATLIDFNSFNAEMRPATGSDLVIISSIPITFKYVKFAWSSPTAEGDYLRTIGGVIPKFRGCYFEFTGASLGGRVFGHFDYEGCGASERVVYPGSAFSRSDYRNCSFMNDQSISPDTILIRDLYLYNSMLEVGRAVATIDKLYIDNIALDKQCIDMNNQGFLEINEGYIETAFNGRAILIDNQSNMILNDVDVTNTFRGCIQAKHGSVLSLQGNCTITAEGTGANSTILLNESSFHVLEGTITVVNNQSSCIELFASKFTRDSSTLSLTAAFNGVFLSYGSQWADNQADTISLNTAGIAISLRKGSNLATSAGVTQAGAGAEFQCGNNAAGLFTKQNDLASGVPEYCFAYID